MPFKFEKLRVWQLSLEYIDQMYRIAESLPDAERYNLNSQLRRAATSVALNIAEGSTGQSDAEQNRFLGMAVRSLVETVACLHLIQRRGYADANAISKALDDADFLARKLQAFRNAIRPRAVREPSGTYAAGELSASVVDGPSSVVGYPSSPVVTPSSVVRSPSSLRVVALAGGVGGAKLADGLAQIIPPENLTVIVNTGDDFEHYGLHISPDLDTVCYTLAGLANPETGWGRADETWNAIENAARLGGPDWFRLGDRDLGTHLERTRRLRAGEPLSVITRDFCRAWGIEHTVLPMSDDPVPTVVETEEGELPFQEYFVHRKTEPAVKGFRFPGVERAQPAPGVRAALERANLVILCPSNPWVSIDPILSVGDIRELVAAKTCIAVSPIIGGEALKGPAAKMYRELGIHPSALAVAEHYRGLLQGFVFDLRDQELENAIQRLGMNTLCAQTIMHTPADRARLAAEALAFGASLL